MYFQTNPLYLFHAASDMTKILHEPKPIMNDNLHIILCMLTCPRSSSARTQPADHISMAFVYSVAPNMSSGAL